jgi:hypothetical protein
VADSLVVDHEAGWYRTVGHLRPIDTKDPGCLQRLLASVSAAMCKGAPWSVFASGVATKLVTITGIKRRGVLPEGQPTGGMNAIACRRDRAKNRTDSYG